MNYERIVKRYYEELENGKILARKCTKCGEVEFPPRIACNACGNFETEWIETTQNVVVSDFILTSQLAHPRINEHQPCVFGFVKIEEGGTEFNALVCGIKPEEEALYKSKLPLSAKARIVQRDGYKALVYDIVK